MLEQRDRRIELEELRGQVREFLDAERAAGAFVPRANAWMGGVDIEFSRRLADRGWVGMAMPREFGGQGLGARARFVVTEELLAAGAPVAYHWIADRQVAPAILRHGTPEQRQTYLPGIVRAEIAFGLGMSEPDSGSDLASVRTRAERVTDGWVLTGTKLWTSGGHVATHLIVLARTATTGPKHAGLSQFLVSLPHTDIRISSIETIDGARHFNEVVFDHAFVPDDALLGVEGNGWQQVTGELVNERAGAERIMSTLPLLREWSLLEPEGIDAQRDLGRLVARLVILRRMGESVASALDSSADAATLASLLKSVGTTYEGELLDVIRHHLGDGGADDLLAKVQECVTESPAFTLRGGTNEVLRSIVAKGLMRA